MRNLAGAVAAAGLVAVFAARGNDVSAAEVARPGAGCGAAAIARPMPKTDVKWLIGTWQNPYYTVRFRDAGGVIRWEMQREAHPSARWGLKSAMQGSGTVTGISPCGLEMTGRYDWDEAARHVGMALNFKGARAGTDGLAGELYGAAQEWTPIQFFKTE